jgi:hypothetical protein
MLTAMNGLAGTFTLTPQCTGLPSESSCSVSPSSVTFSSTTTTSNVMLTVATMAPSSVAPGRRVHPTVTGPGIVIAFSALAIVAVRFSAQTARASVRAEPDCVRGAADDRGLRRREWRRWPKPRHAGRARPKREGIVYDRVGIALRGAVSKRRVSERRTRAGHGQLERGGPGWLFSGGLHGVAGFALGSAAHFDCSGFCKFIPR